MQLDSREDLLKALEVVLTVAEEEAIKMSKKSVAEQEMHIDRLIESGHIGQALLLMMGEGY